MVDYPARARLKFFARAMIVELADDPALFELLDLEGYKFRPERMMVFSIEGYDWNCQQHITPRYSLDDMKEFFDAQRDRISRLEEEVKELKAKLKDRTG